MARSREWERKNPEKFKAAKRNARYRQRYGITLVEYNNLLKKQHGGCHICKAECRTGKQLAVDHCHMTGMVRGLLCFECNVGLGKFKDSVQLIARALAYLKSSTHGRKKR